MRQQWIEDLSSQSILDRDTDDVALLSDIVRAPGFEYMIGGPAVQVYAEQVVRFETLSTSFVDPRTDLDPVPDLDLSFWISDLDIPQDGSVHLYACLQHRM